MKTRVLAMAAVMAATALVAVATPAQAYVTCEENLGGTYFSIRCKSLTYGASYNSYVYCTNGGRYEGPYYFLSGNDKWGPWSTANCPGGQYVESYGKETYG